MSGKKSIGGRLVINDVKLPLSRAIEANGFIFVSGQLALQDGKIVGDDIETQARVTMDNVKSILAQAGATMDDIVKATIWLTDASEFGRFNDVYRTYFGDDPPARSCIISQLLLPEAKVEVEVQALARN